MPKVQSENALTRIKDYVKEKKIDLAGSARSISKVHATLLVVSYVV